MSDLLRQASRYLDDHWILKWFVVPILFMASILFFIGAFMVRTTPGETAQLVGLFVGFSLAVVALGLLLDWGTRRVAGWDLLTSNRDRGG